jgi:hypothetical protein
MRRLSDEFSGAQSMSKRNVQSQTEAAISHSRNVCIDSISTQAQYSRPVENARGRVHRIVKIGINSNVNFVTCNNLMDTSPVARWLRYRLVVTITRGGSGSSG